MNVEVLNSSYVYALKENADFKDNPALFSKVKEGLQFKYGAVSFKEFEQKYVPGGWFGRKITALCAAIWSGVVKTIYHIVLAIFVSLFKPDRALYLKVHLFKIARDLQEAFGHILTIFNDRYGQFHTQEGQFHQDCYDYFLEHKHSKIKLDNLNLAEFDNMINMFPSNKRKRQKKIASLDPLEFRYAIRHFIRNFTLLEFISPKQLQCVSLTPLSSGDISDIFFRCRDADKPRRMENIEISEIQNAITKDKIESRHLDLISPKQLKGLDFSKLPQKVINSFFPSYRIDDIKGQYYKCSEQDAKKIAAENKRKYDKQICQLTSQQLKVLEPRLFREESIDDNDDEFGNFFKNFFTGVGSFFKIDAEATPSLDKKEAYKILELPQGASKEEIKATYKKLMLKFHPDKNKQKQDESDADYQSRMKKCGEEFSKVRKAYQILVGN